MFRLATGREGDYCPLTAAARQLTGLKYDTGDYDSAAEAIGYRGSSDPVILAADHDGIEDNPRARWMRAQMKKALL